MDELRKLDPRSMSDDDLLQAVLGKDDRAWQELLRRFRALIFRCIARVACRYHALVGNEDINEIFSEVCLSFLRDDMRKLRAYDPSRGSRLGSWLGLLAINATYDFLRQATRRPALVHLDPLDGQSSDPLCEQPAQGPSALDDLIEKERWGLLNGLLADFSSRDRRFIELYYGNGLAPEEVATVMGISVKTVYSKKHKLHMRLAQLARRGAVPGATPLAA